MKINLPILCIVALTLGLASCSKDGAVGPQGPAGTNGTAGPKGDSGSRGPAGINGTNGTNGVNGAPGVTGLTGPIGNANVILDSVVVKSSDWHSGSYWYYVVSVPQLTSARLLHSAVMVYQADGSSLAKPLPFNYGSDSHMDFQFEKGKVWLISSTTSVPSIPHTFIIVIVPAAGYAYAASHGIPLSTYQDVRRAFNLK